MCTILDGDELFEHCKGLSREKNELADKVENIAVEKDELTKVVVDLHARLKESESELRVSKDREATKELKEELLVYKKDVIDQHKKGFYLQQSYNPSHNIYILYSPKEITNSKADSRPNASHLSTVRNNLFQLVLDMTM